MSVEQARASHAPQTTTGSMPAAEKSERPIGRKLGDVKTVAEKLDCSSRHVYRLADAGLMPKSKRLGALVRWDLEEIDEWISAGCPPCRKAGGR